MKDNKKTKKELLNELINLRRKVKRLEQVESLHKKAEETMLRLSAVVRDSTDAITVQRLDGTILDWNRGAELVYGWKADEVIGKNIKIIIPDDRYTEKDEMRNRLVKGEISISFETRRITKSGKIIDIWLTLGRLTDKNGDVNAISTIERDITDRKRKEIALRESEARLREQKDILEQKNAAFRELIGHIEIEKKIIKDQVSANVEELLLPLFKKIKMQDRDNKYMELLEHNLRDMTSSFGIRITDVHLRLSPREIEICNMIKSGFTNKEISGLLNIAYKTAERHRNNIRKKVGIVNKDINLTTFLKAQSS